MKNHLLSLFLMAICSGFFSASAAGDEKSTKLSQADKDRFTPIAQKLALCAGVYDMVSEIHKVTNSPALSVSTHETANGAETAAAYLMAITGIIPDGQYALTYVKNARNSEKTRQSALLEVAGNSPEKIDNAIGNLTESMKECNTLSDLQAEMVQQAKLWMYSNQPKR
jgi:hypothetical protein